MRSSPKALVAGSLSLCLSGCLNYSVQQCSRVSTNETACRHPLLLVFSSLYQEEASKMRVEALIIFHFLVSLYNE